MGPIGYTETSARNNHYSLRNNPEERSSRLSLYFHCIELFSVLIFCTLGTACYGIKYVVADK